MFSAPEELEEYLGHWLGMTLSTFVALVVFFWFLGLEGSVAAFAVMAGLSVASGTAYVTLLLIMRRRRRRRKP